MWFWLCRVNKDLKLTDIFTFVLEYIMSITGDATENHICVLGVPVVDFLGLHVKPALIRHKTIPENVTKTVQNKQALSS